MPKPKNNKKLFLLESFLIVKRNEMVKLKAALEDVEQERCDKMISTYNDWIRIVHKQLNDDGESPQEAPELL